MSEKEAHWIVSDSRTTTTYLLDRRFSKKSINFLKTPKISREEKNEIRRKVVLLSLMPAPPLLWLMKFYQLKRFPFNRFLDIFREGFSSFGQPAGIHSTYTFFSLCGKWMEAMLHYVPFRIKNVQKILRTSQHYGLLAFLINLRKNRECLSVMRTALKFFIQELDQTFSI